MSRSTGGRQGVDVSFYAGPSAMSALPASVAPGDLPTDLDGLRKVVQGLLLHRDWAPAYGVVGEAIRLDEQHLRSTAEILARAHELSPEPITTPRVPLQRVLGVCRHFTLLHTALLRAQGIPARVRCGFSSYFDATKWYDHWITERWDDGRWVRDDPQIDGLQAKVVQLDFDPYDQPPGRFLSADEAWAAARAGDVDPDRFGIFDMWGLSFIAGNVRSDFACLNKVELLPWDDWGMLLDPHRPMDDRALDVVDGVAALATTDDTDAIRERFAADDRLRVPADISSYQDGQAVAVHLEL